MNPILERLVIPPLIVAGVFLWVRAGFTGRQGRHLASEPIRATYHLARAFRLAVSGAGCLGVAAGLWLDASWLVWLSVVFALEELYEATFLVGAMRWAEEAGWPNVPVDVRPASGASTALPATGHRAFWGR